MADMSHRALTLMIQGTASDVGKSLLVAALCRIYARRGLKVTPFKSQNMSLNSYAGPDGAEIGRAQALQAIAARRIPQGDMNPVLLKPEADQRSQIVVNGRPWKTLEGRDYLSMRKLVWPEVTAAMDRLLSDNDLIIIEGAGSPAEINLNDREIVNMSVARYLDAPVLLAADIDRGGVFASIVGTLALLDDDDRNRIKGFLINKFRGDVSLLEPGLDMLSDRTDGRRTLAVIPWIGKLRLAKEDSVALEGLSGMGSYRGSGRDGDVDIAIPRFPGMANFDDLDALVMEEGVGLSFVESPGEMGKPSAILLPGSKTTLRDLAWLRESGLADAVVLLAREGTPVAGICGGFQMLGNIIDDVNAVESGGGKSQGLGLLDISTVFSEGKQTRPVKGSGAAGFARDSVVTGYEIHMGNTSRGMQAAPLFILDEGVGLSSALDGALSPNGRIWGTYLHGVFDEPGFRRSWLESIGWNCRGEARSLEDERESELNRLADTVRESLDMELLDRIIGVATEVN